MTEYTLVSVDIETTGPAPSVAEMCSIGAVALDDDMETAEAFSVNLEFKTPGDPMVEEGTMRWWKHWPEQWNAHRTDVVQIKDAMWKFTDWLEKIRPSKPLFVAWPVGFDWGFVNYYFHKYVGFNPFGYSPLCLKNYAAGVLRHPGMLGSSREEAFMPDDWLVTPEDIGLVPHIAVNDAIAQAMMIRNIMRYTG